MQRAVDRRQQQRQRAAAGAVGHEHADAAPVEVHGGELIADERPDLLLGEDAVVRPADDRCGAPAGRVPQRSCCAIPASHLLSRARATCRGNLASGRGGCHGGRRPHHEHGDHRVHGLTASGPAAARRARRPRDRAPALRRGARAAGHLAARSRRPAAAARRRAVPRPGDAVRDARPLRDAAAARRRRRARRARRRAGAAARGAGPRAVWRLLCAHWDVFRGTPVRFWLEAELARDLRRRGAPVGGDGRRDLRPARRAAGRATPTGPRALFERFRIAVLATTDDPCDDLSAHAALAADPTWSGRVIPTFRPDRYLEPAQPGWPDAVARLGEVADVDTGDYAGYVRRAGGAPAVLRRARRDLGRPQPRGRPHRPARTGRGGAASTARRWPATATRGGGRGVPPAHAAGDGADVVRRRAGDDAAPGRAPRPPPADRRAVRARHRPRHPAAGRVHRRAAPAAGALRHAPGFHLVVFTLDETVFSRELAPLAGFYPSVYVGAPWWFLDAPRGDPPLPRARSPRPPGSPGPPGFIDDTRAFCSIPARHDMSRRLDAGWLAELVAEHRLDEDEALETRDRPRRRPPARGVQAVSGPSRRRVRRGGRPRRRCGSSTSGSATSSAPTRPGTPTARPTPRTGASPPSPAAARDAGRRARRAQDGLYTLVTRGRRRRPLRA